MAGAWRGYLKLLEKYPLRTQAVTSGTMFFISDVVAQEFVEKAGWEKYDVNRAIRQTGFGFCFAGPALFTWYRILDRYVKGAEKILPLKKMICDQVCFAPFFITSYFTVISFASGMPPSEVPKRLRKDVPTTMLTGYKIWPPVQIVNFYFVPLYHRVMVVNIVAFFWNTYLSWKANAKLQGKVD